MHTSHRPIGRTTALALAASLTLPLCATAQGTSGDMGLVVSPEWLAARLDDPSVVVLHLASNRREYTSGHIPGARFLWFNDVAPGNPDLNTELPSVERLDELFETLGVSDNSRIVVYGQTLNPIVTRVLMTLDYLGAGDRSAVLDGGLTAWKAEGRPVSTETPKVARGRFTPRVNRDVVVDAAFVSSSIEKPGVRILDARAANFYTGEGGGGPRPGHIPSAKNVPFMTLLDANGKLKDKATLADMFSTAGVEQGDRVVTYCHVGQQATLLWLAARQAGLRASVYDGSFEDWSWRTELPVVGPTKP